MDMFDHVKSVETWSKFGEYVLTNTSVARSVQEAFDDFQNGSISDMLSDKINEAIETLENETMNAVSGTAKNKR